MGVVENCRAMGGMGGKAGTRKEGREKVVVVIVVLVRAVFPAAGNMSGMVAEDGAVESSKSRCRSRQRPRNLAHVIARFPGLPLRRS